MAEKGTIVYIPTPLRQLTEGQSKVNASGATVAQVIDDLETNYPGLRDRICEDGGEVKRFVNVFVNGEEIRSLEGAETSVASGDEISIIPAMAGGEGYASSEALVSTDWVEEHRKDHDVRIVEVDVDTTAYEVGHIPEAVGWNWEEELQDQVERDVVGREDFAALMSRSGISNDTTVVLYGDNNNWFATWGFWLLKYYGHDDVRVMDGGRQKWIDEGRDVGQEVPDYPSTPYSAQEPDTSVRAFRKYVLGSIDRDDRAFVDVRSPDEYTGRLLAPPDLQETAQRGGHIPGAANIPWSQAVRSDGTFKPADELKVLYQNKGVTPDKEVITYCRIGERSSHSWFVLSQLLGYPEVRNYDGSWTEYGSMVGLPIERE